ncbi:abortive infection family protein [Serratia marcescens]|uniref:abortive infection family protein n=1 Tax=Serratia marcescens TaxID=615 RepID=UPI0013DC9457|nr:abortive infection family protein [Serratia marcescens]
MDRSIPQPIIAVVSEFMSIAETHATLDNLFIYADAPGEAPPGSKPAKATAWLRRINKESPDPLSILAKLIEAYMDSEPEPYSYELYKKQMPDFVDKIHQMLSKYTLSYVKGGFITDGSSIASMSLQEAIKGKNMPAIEAEFKRALEHVHKEPRESVSAACNILESVCKIYITDEGLTMPAKQDLQGVWKVVKDNLGMDPQRIEDNDLRRILTGLFSVVDGIGAFRTHASTAHGAGRVSYNVLPRHARLAINAAHSLVLYLIESWEQRKESQK